VTDGLSRQVAALVAGLARGGVRDVVVAPGSRSTPLALMAHRFAGLRVLMHYDERGAGYFALGLARRTGRPVAVVVTSGTAAANLLPAAVEASLAGIPLVLLTADRPPEAQEVGTPQTIDQERLYGRHAKWAMTLAAAAGEAGYETQARAMGERAARLAWSAPRGTVHLNLPFREPLLPDPAYTPDTEVPEWRAPATPALDLGSLADRWAGQEGIVVAGATNLRPAADALFSLADRLGWPILADPLSNLRGMHHPALLSAYDLWLRRGAPAPPSVVIRFGAPPTSKVLSEWLRDVPTVLVDERDRWRDAGRGAVEVLWADDLGRLTIASGPSAKAMVGETWAVRDRAAARLLQERLATLPGDFEGWAFQRWSQAFQGYQAVQVGSSMPIRDLDSFWRGEPGDPVVYANRGANGIDGVVSSGLGAAAAGGPVAIVLGDLSFWHDVNGLLAARLHRLDAAILVNNNNGGGIFSFLPQAGLEAAEFEPLFGTPHGLDLSGAARLVGARFFRTTEWGAAEAALRAARTVEGLTLVEWQTKPRAENARLHQELLLGVADTVSAIP
jgi:2-succinyl-5-enolpyruvyl-6-hydroxy-3-cyclohexene-1-carboxylate synthase